MPISDTFSNEQKTISFFKNDFNKIHVIVFEYLEPCFYKKKKKRSILVDSVKDRKEISFLYIRPKKVAFVPLSPIKILLLNPRYADVSELPTGP